jgi:hypothetical protein
LGEVISQKGCRGQKSLWDEWDKPDKEIRKVAENFQEKAVMMVSRLVTGNEMLEY